MNNKMKEFPEKLKPKYRHLFDELAFTQQLEEWRKKVFSYIINHETRGLTLTNDNYQKIDNKILNVIIEELSQLGWKTKLAFNGTVLFIFEQEEEIENFKYAISDEIIDEPVI
jgi:hypothetical protein